MAAITYTDVATEIGRPISDATEQAQVAQWIADVEVVLGARLGDLTALDQTLLKYVERMAVVARLKARDNRNADGQQQTSTAEWSFADILDPWWVLLDPGDTGSGAFSARPYFTADTTDPLAGWMFG